MKRLTAFLSVILLLFSLSSPAFAYIDSPTQQLSIPSPNDIQAHYTAIFEEQNLTSTLSEPSYSGSILSDDSFLQDQPLLKLGIIGTIAEVSSDLTVLESAASSARTEIIPFLSADDYITIISNDEYTNSFRFSVIDMYSFSQQTFQTLNATDLSLVDQELKSLVIPHGDLSISAMTSISDKSIITVQQLSNVLLNGTIDEQQVALKTMCQVYPETAATYIYDILSNNEFENSVLYRSAIRFIPRLIEMDNAICNNEALEIIDNVLSNSDDFLVQLACVHTLEDINSVDAANVLSSHPSIPAPLVNHFLQHTDVSLEYDIASTATMATASTTNRLGNAIYRDGVDIPLTDIEINWHTGLVAHASGPEYNTTGKWVIHHPGNNVDGEKVVRYDTYNTFKDGNTPKGEYCMSDMTLSDHMNVFFTAEDLVDEGIPYTFLSILTTSKGGGNIEPSDITKIRCDGVVEYCYEYNGIRLQGGAYWNIATYLGALNHDSVLMSPKTQHDVFDLKVN